MPPRKPLGGYPLPELYLCNIPNLFGVTRKEGKTTLVCATSHEEALRKYNELVSQFPDPERPQETLDAVCAVQAVK